jgi:hypothetical protein
MGEITTMKTCIGCPSHRVLPDPDPHDWFYNHICSTTINVRRG